MICAEWTVVTIMLITLLQSASEGFFHASFGVAGLVVGYLLAALHYHRLAEWFAPHLKSPWLGEITGFLIIFFAVLIVAGIAGRIARSVMKKAGLSAVDRFLGAVLGLLKGLLAVAIVLT